MIAALHVVKAALLALLLGLMALKTYNDYNCAPAEWLYMYGFIDRKAYHARPDKMSLTNPPKCAMGFERT